MNFSAEYTGTTKLGRQVVMAKSMCGKALWSEMTFFFGVKLFDDTFTRVHITAKLKLVTQLANVNELLNCIMVLGSLNKEQAQRMQVRKLVMFQKHIYNLEGKYNHHFFTAISSLENKFPQVLA